MVAVKVLTIARWDDTELGNGMKDQSGKSEFSDFVVFQGNNCFALRTQRSFLVLVDTSSSFAGGSVDKSLC